MMDLIKPIHRPAEDVVERTRQAIEEILNIEKKIEGRQGKEGRFSSAEEAAEKLLTGYTFLHGDEALTPAAASHLVERGLSPCQGDTFNFSYDLKHRQRSLYGLHPEYLTEFASKICCPHLLIKAKEKDTVEDDMGDLNKR